MFPDVTNTASFDPLAPCSGRHRSARMALPSESWQGVIPEKVTTLSELKDIEEALKDGKETLAALLRYLVSCSSLPPEATFNNNDDDNTILRSA